MSNLQTLQVKQERLECYLCGKANSLDVTECGDCTAPMDISETFADGRIPQIITALGAPGVGKSVYLGMLLDNLTRQRDRSEVTSFGTSASQLQQSVVSALARGEFPDEETVQDWTWAHCQLSRSTRKTPLDVYLPDFPGMAIIEDCENRRSWPLIRPAIAKSAGAMLFIDGAAAGRGDKDEEFFALQVLRHYTTIRKQEPHELKHRKGQADSNIAIVLTKADQSDDCRQRTEEFVRGQLPGLWQFCQDRLPCHKFFAASVAGASVTVKDLNGYKTEVPLRVEPQGILEPFRWLLGKIAA